jgi:hypothetical protein
VICAGRSDVLDFAVGHHLLSLVDRRSERNGPQLWGYVHCLAFLRAERTRRGERRSIGETNIGPEVSADSFVKAALGSWDRMFVREVQPKRKLSALTARSFELSTLPQGVWQISRSAYELHDDDRSIAHDQIDEPMRLGCAANFQALDGRL